MELYEDNSRKTIDPISIAENALFYALLTIWHSLKNRKIFRASNSQLYPLSGIKNPKTLKKAQERLVKRKVILCQKKHKNISAQYSFNALFGDKNPFQLVKNTAKITSYNVPQKLQKYLQAFESHYYTKIPMGVQEVTHRFSSEEVVSLEEAIREQISANREIVLLYNRKGISVAYRLKQR